MDIVFVIPGIMGSELFLNGAKIWPPRALHNVNNPRQLLDQNVVTGDIIRDVFVFGFYSKLLMPLETWGYREHSAGNKGLVIVWPYNWVRGIPENASLLATSIRSAMHDHPDSEIVLLAHSMGGLISTYALECLSDGNTSWRERVRLLVTFGAPFRGAPQSLKNAFGLEGVMGITASDCQQLMAEPDFPSAYQLFPHLVTLPAWSGHAPLSPLSDYQSLDPSGPPLGKANLKAAIDFQHKMQTGTANPRTRRFNFCGSRLNTVWGVGTAQEPGRVIDSYESKAGDGTVPSWSGRQHEDVQFAPLGAKHSTTFGDEDLLGVLHDLLVRPVSPRGPGSGSGMIIGRKPRDPHQQPHVSVTTNAISSQRPDIEIEVSEPPLGDMLNLAWVKLKEDLETPEDLFRYLSEARFNTIEAHYSIQLGNRLEFPLQLFIPPPKEVGHFALVGWSGELTREVSGLGVERMDVVWVFSDNGRGDTTTGGSNWSRDDLGDFLDAKSSAQDENRGHAARQMGYLTGE